MEYHFLSFLLLLIIIISVTFIDIKTKKIPDHLTITGIILFLVLKKWGGNQSLTESLIVIFTGFTPFFLIWYFTKGKMGLGDAKFSAFLALFLGIERWFIMVFLSSLSALIFAGIMLLLKRINRDSKIPYGPFLSLGALAALYINI